MFSTMKRGFLNEMPKTVEKLIGNFKKLAEQQRLIVDGSNAKFSVHNTMDTIEIKYNNDQFIFNNKLMIKTHELITIRHINKMFDLIQYMNSFEPDIYISDHIIKIKETNGSKKKETMNALDCQNLTDHFIVMLAKLVEFSQTHPFTIQILHSEQIAINRTLFINPSTFLQFNNPLNIIKLVELYRETLEINYIVPPMQSLSPSVNLDMNVWEDFVEFSDGHLIRHQNEYLKIAKLINPILDALPEKTNELLLNEIVETIPLEFIQPLTPIRIRKTLEIFKKFGYTFKILANGHLLINDMLFYKGSHPQLPPEKNDIVIVRDLEVTAQKLAYDFHYDEFCLTRENRYSRINIRMDNNQVQEIYSDFYATVTLSRDYIFDRRINLQIKHKSSPLSITSPIRVHDLAHDHMYAIPDKIIVLNEDISNIKKEYEPFLNLLEENNLKWTINQNADFEKWYIETAIDLVRNKDISNIKKEYNFLLDLLEKYNLKWTINQGGALLIENRFKLSINDIESFIYEKLENVVQALLSFIQIGRDTGIELAIENINLTIIADFEKSYIETGVDLNIALTHVMKYWQDTIKKDDTIKIFKDSLKIGHLYVNPKIFYYFKNTTNLFNVIRMYTASFRQKNEFIKCNLQQSFLPKNDAVGCDEQIQLSERIHFVKEAFEYLRSISDRNLYHFLPIKLMPELLMYYWPWELNRLTTALKRAKEHRIRALVLADGTIDMGYIQIHPEIFVNILSWIDLKEVLTLFQKIFENASLNLIVSTNFFLGYRGHEDKEQPSYIAFLRSKTNLNPEDRQALEKSLKIFTKISPKGKDQLRIFNNGTLNLNGIINTRITTLIDCDERGVLKHVLKAISFLKNAIGSNHPFKDNWFSIGEEEYQRFPRESNLFILKKKEKVYLKLAKMLSPGLKEISDELLSHAAIHILPNTFIGIPAKKVLKNLNIIKQWDFIIGLDGLLCSPNIIISPKLLSDLEEPIKLQKALQILNKFSPNVENKKNKREFFICEDTLFEYHSATPNLQSVSTFPDSLLYKPISINVFIAFILLFTFDIMNINFLMNEKRRKLLTITVNWNGLIRFGDCLTTHPEYLCHGLSNLDDTSDDTIYEVIVCYKEALGNKNIEPVLMASISIASTNHPVYINIVKALNPPWKDMCEEQMLPFKLCFENLVQVQNSTRDKSKKLNPEWEQIYEENKTSDILCQSFIKSLPYVFLLDRPRKLDENLLQITKGITNEYVLFYENDSGKPIDDPTEILTSIESFQKNFSLNLAFNGELIISECFVILPTIFWRIKDKSEFLESIKIFHDICENVNMSKNLKYNRDPIIEKKVNVKKNFSNVLAACERLNKLGLTRVDYMISSDGTIKLFNALWVRPIDCLEWTEKLIEASRKLRNILGNEEFSCEFSPFGIFSYKKEHIENLHKEDYIDYCKMVCDFVEETEPSIKIEYNPHSRRFLLNNLITIHPRSFVHLQDLKFFLEALKDLTPSSGRAFDDEAFLKDERIQKIIQNERIQLLPKRKYFLRKLGKILSENMTFLNNLKNIRHKLHTANEVKDFYKFDEGITLKEYYNNANGYDLCIQAQLEQWKNYNIESFTIKGKCIFDSDITDSLENAIEWKTSWKTQVILISLKLVDDFSLLNSNDYGHGCENIFHLGSFINFVIAYVNHVDTSDGKQKFYETLYKFESEYVTMFDEYKKLVRQFKKMHQDKKYIYKYGSLYSAVHHYYKHGIKYGSPEDYYEEMNHFFKSQHDHCIRVFYNQDGSGIRKNFHSTEYTGNLMSRISLTGEMITFVINFHKSVEEEDEKTKQERRKKHQETVKIQKELHKGKVYLHQELSSDKYPSFSKNLLISDNLLDYYRGQPQYTKGEKREIIIKNGEIQYNNKRLEGRITVNLSDKSSILDICDAVENFDFVSREANKKIENVFLMLGSEMLLNKHDEETIFLQLHQLCEIIYKKLPDVEIFLFTIPIQAIFNTKKLQINENINKFVQANPDLKCQIIDLASMVNEEAKKCSDFSEDIGLTENQLTSVFTKILNQIFEPKKKSC